MVERAGGFVERAGSMVEHAVGMLGRAGSVLGRAGSMVLRAGSMLWACWEHAGSMLERAGNMVGACWSVLGACPGEKKKAVVWTLGPARAPEFAQIIFFPMVWCMTMVKKINNKRFHARARTRSENRSHPK